MAINLKTKLTAIKTHTDVTDKEGKKKEEKVNKYINKVPKIRRESYKTYRNIILKKV